MVGGWVVDGTAGGKVGKPVGWGQVGAGRWVDGRPVGEEGSQLIGRRRRRRRLGRQLPSRWVGEPVGQKEEEEVVVGRSASR